MMSRRLKRLSAGAALGCAAWVLAGCANMTWDQKLEALRAAADRGADAHYVLLTKEQKPTKDTCSQNYEVFMGSGNTPPDEFGHGASSQEWRDLHLSYFVDSCVTGKPRQPHTRPPDKPTPTTNTSNLG
ncbi:hypothetical protein [Prauserella oleivorans]